MEQPLACVVASFGYGDADASDRCASAAARNMQLVNQHEQDVELPHGAQTFCYAPESSVQLVRRRVVELEQGEQLAKPARCDARAMKRPDVAVLYAVKNAGEPIEPFLEQF